MRLKRLSVILGLMRLKRLSVIVGWCGCRCAYRPCGQSRPSHSACLGRRASGCSVPSHLEAFREGLGWRYPVGRSWGRAGAGARYLPSPEPLGLGFVRWRWRGLRCFYGLRPLIGSGQSGWRPGQRQSARCCRRHGGR